MQIILDINAIYRKIELKRLSQKKCSGCHEYFPHKNFYKNRAAKDGLSNLCIKCQKESCAIQRRKVKLLKPKKPKCGKRKRRPIEGFPNP